MSELVQLAERFIQASAELDAIRSAMKKLLLNGSDPHPPRPTQPPGQARGARAAKKKKPQKQHPSAVSRRRPRPRSSRC